MTLVCDKLFAYATSSSFLNKDTPSDWACKTLGQLNPAQREVLFGLCNITLSLLIYRNLSRQQCCKAYDKYVEPPLNNALIDKYVITVLTVAL